MKPGYWVGVLALAGAVVGYAVFRWTGWLGTTTGGVVGFVIGLAVYAQQTRKSR